MANSIRQQKFARLVQKELSEIFQRDKHGYLDNAFITIAEVKVSPDLGVAKVYVSMMLAKDKQGILSKLELHKRDIRRALGEKIRNQARIVPELVFFLDEVEENAMRMDKLIESLNIPPASSSGTSTKEGPPEKPKKK
jgi:ribosome-binding factor A